MAENGSTQTDPLTNATRTTKRNLLAAAVVAITIRAFDISADKIPVAGLTISYDRGAFEFLLLVVLVYFLVTFALYYYIDIRNFAQLPHQVATETWRKAELDEFVDSTVNGFASDVEPTRQGPTTCLYMNLTSRDQIAQWAEGLPSVIRFTMNIRANPLTIEHILFAKDPPDFRRDRPPPTLLFATSAKTGIDESDQWQVKTAAAAAKAWSARMKFLPVKYALFRMSMRPRLWTVSSAYFLRIYGVDGALPIVMAVVALASLYDLVDVHILSTLAPRQDAT